jgi:hypothetical protein
MGFAWDDKEQIRTFTHRLELPHHPLHDILGGLFVLPPPRDLEEELVEGHAVGDVPLVQVFEGC